MTAARARKALKIGLLEAARAAGLMALSRRATRHAFNIVGFHGVSLEDEHARFPTLFISPGSFERRLRFLARHYRIVPLEEAVEQHRTGRIQPNQVVLTFDDGFYNFLPQAIPLLKKYGAPATVYIATAEVESGEPTYNLLARDLVLSTPMSNARGLPHAPELMVDLATLPARNRAAAAAVEALNATCATGAERLAFCRALAEAVRVDVEAKLRSRMWDRLTPEEVRTVVAGGFDVQLHTHSHRNVIAYRGRVRDEIRANREVLERLAGRRPVHFCYPLGLWDRAVWDDLAAEGIRSAVTTKNGPNFPETPALALRRYLTGEAMTDVEFESDLSGIRWAARAAFNPRLRFEASEKRLRYKERPELY